MPRRPSHFITFCVEPTLNPKGMIANIDDKINCTTFIPKNIRLEFDSKM